MRFLLRLVPLSLVEVAARLLGFMVGVRRPHGSYQAERVVRGLYWGRRFGGRRVWIGRGVQFEGERVTLGDGVRLYDGGQYVTGSAGWITIGAHTHISRLSVVSGIGGVSIGSGCAISSHVAIYSVSGDAASGAVAVAPRLKKPVSIGDNVYIGLGVKIIPGVTIGDDAVIAAGAVVIRDVPSGHLAKGVPAASRPVVDRTMPTGSGESESDGA